MRADFSHTLDDYVEASQARPGQCGLAGRADPLRRTCEQRTRSEVLRARGGVVGSIGLLLMLGASTDLGLRLSRWWLVLSALIMAFLLLVFIRNRQLPFAREFRSDPRNRDSAFVEVNDDGVRFGSSKWWQCHVEWSSMRELRETTALFLLIDDDPTTLIVPKRAFASAAGCDEFRQFVRAHLNAEEVAVEE